MNPLQHYEVVDEKLEGIFYGQVIKNDDPEGLYRVKVRVRGVFDEPVKKEHIPWSMPLVGGDRVPELGSEVAVMFEKGDVERPQYMPAGFLTKEHITRLLGVYESVVDTKKGARQTGISVDGGTWDEPETESVAEFKYNKQVDIWPDETAQEQGEGVEEGEPQSGIIEERVWEDGSQMWSVYHTVGTWMEITSAGALITHVKDNFVEVVEGDKNELSQGTRRVRVDQDFLLEAGNGVTLVVGSAKITIDSAGEVQVEGPSLRVNGLASPTPGQGPFCALPTCVFSGAPHIGHTSAGN